MGLLLFAMFLGLLFVIIKYSMQQNVGTPEYSDQICGDTPEEIEEKTKEYYEEMRRLGYIVTNSSEIHFYEDSPDNRYYTKSFSRNGKSLEDEFFQKMQAHGKFRSYPPNPNVALRKEEIVGATLDECSKRFENVCNEIRKYGYRIEQIKDMNSWKGTDGREHYCQSVTYVGGSLSEDFMDENSYYITSSIGVK